MIIVQVISSFYNTVLVKIGNILTVCHTLIIKLSGILTKNLLCGLASYTKYLCTKYWSNLMLVAEFFVVLIIMNQFMHVEFLNVHNIGCT